MNIDKILAEITPSWEELKKALDKYPGAFSLKYEPEEGYLISVDLDSLEHPVGNQDKFVGGLEKEISRNPQSEKVHLKTIVDTALEMQRLREKYPNASLSAPLNYLLHSAIAVDFMNGKGFGRHLSQIQSLYKDT